tara:strand:- start:1703 stop:1894 length:192 start_codon:yes stop_codon:yes gene_type:complete
MPKKIKKKIQPLPLDMERAIRDYTADKNKVKEQIFESPVKPKPLKKKKNNNKNKNVKKNNSRY